MKKSLLALAVLGAFAGAASAQSSVTLYGTVDLAIERSNNKSGAGVSTNDQSMAKDRRGTTQISVKGVEDLGGGMSAIFLVENDFAAWDAAHALAGGEAYVGLTGGFGTVKLGSPNEPTLSSQAGRQPFRHQAGWWLRRRGLQQRQHPDRSGLARPRSQEQGAVLCHPEHGRPDRSHLPDR